MGAEKQRKKRVTRTKNTYRFNFNCVAPLGFDEFEFLKNSRRKTPVHADPPLRQLLSNKNLLIRTQNSNNRRQNWTRARKIAASTGDCAGVETSASGGNTKRGRRREEKKKGGKIQERDES